MAHEAGCCNSAASNYSQRVGFVVNGLSHQVHLPVPEPRTMVCPQCGHLPVSFVGTLILPSPFLTIPVLGTGARGFNPSVEV